MSKEGYKIGGYRISDIYQGGYSSLMPPPDNYVTAGSLGMTTDPRSANILKEVSEKLSSGTKNIEVEAVSPEIFDSIPKHYFKEVNRMAKLTGIKVSLHGPVMDVAGMSQQGFSETSREAAERRVAETLLRSHDLNPDGNMTVNFHSAEGIPGSEFLPPSQRTKETNYKRMIAVNRESGRLIPLEEEKEFNLGGDIKERTRSAEQRLEGLNSTEWKNSLFQIEVNRENADRIMKDIHPIFISKFAQLHAGQLKPEDVDPKEMAQINKVASAFEFIGQAKLSADSLFDKAYKFAKMDNDEENMDLLKEFSKRYGEMVGIEGNKIKNPERYLNPEIHAGALQEFIQILENAPPKSYVPLEGFATEQTSKTFGNAAWTAYKKFKDKSPVLVIENPPAGFALSTGEGVADTVRASRRQFVQNAVKEGMSEKEAERNAEKFIGATWDVGHINMLRKYGYSEEEIIKEAEKVAPLVKHVHLSDNFGYEHTELPMGMGNVPLKQMMEKLGEKGFEATKIIEAGNWWQHFRTSPFQESLEAMESPIYGMKMAPYWSQAPGLYQGYFSGYGQMLPQINYEIFGAGFSRLPSELGGQAGGGQGNRMSGRPME
jgi:sugar phosphate isomerase/epimerase